MAERWQWIGLSFTPQELDLLIKAMDGRMTSLQRQQRAIHDLGPWDEDVVVVLERIRAAKIETMTLRERLLEAVAGVEKPKPHFATITGPDDVYRTIRLPTAEEHFPHILFEGVEHQIRPTVGEGTVIGRPYRDDEESTDDQPES